MFPHITFLYLAPFTPFPFSSDRGPVRPSKKTADFFFTFSQVAVPSFVGASLNFSFFFRFSALLLLVVARLALFLSAEISCLVNRKFLLSAFSLLPVLVCFFWCVCRGRATTESVSFLCPPPGLVFKAYFSSLFFFSVRMGNRQDSVFPPPPSF